MCRALQCFVRAKRSLGSTGVLGSVGPQNSDDGDGPMLVVSDLPVEAVAAMRKGDAYVWPGAWSADHLKINDPANRLIADQPRRRSTSSASSGMR